MGGVTGYFSTGVGYVTRQTPEVKERGHRRRVRDFLRFRSAATSGHQARAPGRLALAFAAERVVPVDLSEHGLRERARSRQHLGASAPRRLGAYG